MEWFGWRKTDPLSEVLPGQILGFLGSPYHGIASIVEKWGPCQTEEMSRSPQPACLSIPIVLAKMYSLLEKTVICLHGGMATADGLEPAKRN